MAIKWGGEKMAIKWRKNGDKNGVKMATKWR